MCKNVPSVPTIQQMHRLSFLYKAALGTKSKTANSSKTTNHNHSGKRIIIIIIIIHNVPIELTWFQLN